MKVRPALQVNMPVSNDTVNVKGEKYGVANLLKQKMNLDFTMGESSKILMNAADSLYSFNNPAEGKVIYLTETKMRPENYMSGKLEVVCNAPFAVLVNGEEKAQKTTAEDSISDASKKSVDLTMQPQATYQVCVKVLADADGTAPKMSMNFVPDEKSENTALYTGPELKHRFLLDDTMMGVRVSHTAISPDGRYLLTYYTNKMDGTNTRRYVVLSEIKSGKVLTSFEKGAWMPKGSTLYFTQKGEDGFDIYTMTLPGMEQKLLYKNVPTDSFTWSPNAGYIVYYDSEEPAKDATPLHRYISPDDRIVGNRTRYFLKKYDFATGAEQILTYGTKSTSMADISHDGNKILYSITRETPSKYPFYAVDLMQMDVKTLKVDTIIKDNPYLASGQYSPDDKKIFITGSPRTFGDIGVNCGNQPIPSDFDTQGFIYDIATKNVVAATRDFDPAISAPVWSASDGNIYFRAADGFYGKLCSLNPNTLKITTLPIQVDNLGSFSIGSQESQWLSYTGQGYNYAGRGYMMNLKSGKSTLIDDPLKPMFDDIEMGTSESWSYTYKDGSVIDGTLTLPPNFDPNKKYPMVVYYYGGCTPSTYSCSHGYVPQLFASRDYVVYVVNPSGTYGYGQEFSARHVNAWGKQTADEIIEGVKEVVRTHPFIDGSKIGCLGASYGGFMTQYLQTLTDIFAAAVSHAGISNVTSYWGEGYWGYSYNACAAAESYPWTNPELFTKQGSLFNADKIHTPLLLLHGTADTNVPIGESIQLFNALKILDREVEFISIEGEDHVSGGYPYDKMLLWQNTIMAWFDKWLKNDSRWWNEMYPTPHL
jgi:dipeptidyl aminopeptidase/acylaminoacyl peptidase